MAIARGKQYCEDEKCSINHVHYTEEKDINIENFDNEVEFMDDKQVALMESTNSKKGHDHNHAIEARNSKSKSHA